LDQNNNSQCYMIYIW